jgi:hypothetical protein
MKLKLVGVLAASLVSAPAFAEKVAEYNDPILGNSYNNCTFTQTYGTGGGGWLYTEYSISCDGGHNPTVGVYEDRPQYSWQLSSCTFYPSSGYTVSGNCSNWRVYTD